MRHDGSRGPAWGHGSLRASSSASIRFTRKSSDKGCSHVPGASSTSDAGKRSRSPRFARPSANTKSKISRAPGNRRPSTSNCWGSRSARDRYPSPGGLFRERLTSKPLISGRCSFPVAPRRSSSTLFTIWSLQIKKLFSRKLDARSRSAGRSSSGRQTQAAGVVSRPSGGRKHCAQPFAAAGDSAFTIAALLTGRSGSRAWDSRLAFKRWEGGLLSRTSWCTGFAVPGERVYVSANGCDFQNG